MVYWNGRINLPQSFGYQLSPTPTIFCKPTQTSLVRWPTPAVPAGSGAVDPDEFAGEADQIGARVVSHGRCAAFQLTEAGVSRQMFADILMFIARLRAPPAPA